MSVLFSYVYLNAKKTNHRKSIQNSFSDFERAPEMKKGKDGFYARYIKRILDFILSLTAILVLSPLLVLLTLIGAVAMKGNPFFMQKRPGKISRKTGKEKIFSLIKFRTMTNEKDKDGNLLPDDKRLNRYGRFLRGSSLDELPELINIIIGDMSVVGPRPLLVKYLPRYSEEQRHRHDVRPGLTGLAQVSGRNALSWEEKFDIDIEYTEKVGFVLDFDIVLKTVKSVVSREGISSDTSVTMEEFKGNRI